MYKDIKITVSEISKESYGNVICYKALIYVECDCGSLRDISRVIITKEYETLEDKKVILTSSDIFFEFPLDDPVNNYVSQGLLNTALQRITYPFKKLWNRIVLAFKMLTFQKVYVCSDIMIDHTTSLELGEKIKDTIEAINKKSWDDFNAEV